MADVAPSVEDVLVSEDGDSEDQQLQVVVVAAAAAAAAALLPPVISNTKSSLTTLARFLPLSVPRTRCWRRWQRGIRERPLLVPLSIFDAVVLERVAAQDNVLMSLYWSVSPRKTMYSCRSFGCKV
jgi:hypothetical protein